MPTSLAAAVVPRTDKIIKNGLCVFEGMFIIIFQPYDTPKAC